MRNLRLAWMVGSVLSLVLTACAGAKPAPTPITSAPQPSPSPATPTPTEEPAGVGVPAMVYPNGQSRLIVVSSVTGKVLDAFAPIQLGDDYAYAFAPDGHTLAVVSVAQLYLVDLPSWKYRKSDVGLHGWLSAIVYSPDGTLLALASGGPDGELRIVDAKSGAVKAAVQPGFSIRNVKFTTDEKSIMVYGPREAGTGVSLGAPVAALYAISDLSLLWSVELKTIRDGIFPKNPKTPDIYQPGAASFFAPAIAFAPDGDMLYAVHGDQDKLTTVNFNARKTTTVWVRPKLSWLDQLMALTAGVAYAKGMDGTSKQAVISADGKYLYVVATTEAVSKDSKGNWSMTNTHSGLQVIAVKDGSLVEQKDTEADSIAFSPDGKHLLLTGWNNGDYAASWTEVYDPASSEILKHMNSIRLTPTRRLDGTPALVSNDYLSDNLCSLASVDPATWTISSAWRGDCIGWLIDP